MSDDKRLHVCTDSRVRFHKTPKGYDGTKNIKRLKRTFLLISLVFLNDSADELAAEIDIIESKKAELQELYAKIARLKKQLEQLESEKDE